MLSKAIFLDRDGIINEMVFLTEHGFVDSPTNSKQFKLIKGVLQAIKIAKKLGYKIIIISNQPGIAKGYYNIKKFEEIREKMLLKFKKAKIVIDDDFYCLHHPNAKLIKYKKNCHCRKPKIGLIKKAVKIHNVDLKKSFFIGDGINDMESAKKAGCKSIFVGNVNSTITKLFKEKNINPEFVAKNLFEAIQFIKKL